MSVSKDKYCLTCGKNLAANQKKFCSRDCLYRSDHWKDLIKEKYSEDRQHGNLRKRTCVSCKQEYFPVNYRQRVCRKCKSHGKKTVLRILRYGISPEEQNALLESQQGKCALCEKPAQHVDHCHSTGKVRGMLCVFCNHAIAAIESIPDWIEKAQSYLENKA